MKYIITRFFDFFKMASTKAYTALASGLLVAQTQLTDPQVVNDLMGMFPDQPLIVRLIQMAPTLLLALFSPRTTQGMDAYKSTKQQL